MLLMVQALLPLFPEVAPQVVIFELLSNIANNLIKVFLVSLRIDKCAHVLYVGLEMQLLENMIHVLPQLSQLCALLGVYSTS